MTITVAAVLLTLAVLGGATLLTLRLRRHANPPLLFAIVHGTFAVSGVVVLLVAVLASQTGGAPLLALFLFGAAAPLGAWLLSRHVRGKLIPPVGALLHGMTALLGYAILLTHFL